MLTAARPDDEDEQPRTLAGLLDHIERTCAREPRVSLEELREAVGARSFGPLLLLVGLAALTPLGVIPGIPTLFAITIILIALQLAIGRDAAWMPGWLLRRSVSGGKLRKAIAWARRPAGWLDRVVKPRLARFTGTAWRRASAFGGVLIALAIPPLELVPFGVGAPAFAITLLGLALTARDGVLLLASLTIQAATLALLGWALLR